MSEQTSEMRMKATSASGPQYVLAYDVGTTGIKTCLFELSQGVKLIESAVGDYGLYVLDNGGAEQIPQEW